MKHVKTRPNSLISSVGQRFEVLPQDDDDEDPNIGQIGIFTGSISINDDNQVTHIWLVFPSSSVDIGYRPGNLQRVGILPVGHKFRRPNETKKTQETVH